MSDLLDLAKAIVKAVPATKRESAGWFLNLYTEESDWRKLPLALRDEVEILANQIGELIPTDVHFTLSFDKRGTYLGFEYSDGTTEATLGGGYPKTREDLFAGLKAIDWTQLRETSLHNMGVFDVLKKQADERPIKIPSSEKDAKKRSKPLVKVLAAVRKKAVVSPFVAIYAKGREPVTASFFKKDGDMMYDMMNALTCQYRLLAILIKGRELNFEEIEARKRKAIEMLTPGSISRAQAEGRF